MIKLSLNTQDTCSFNDFCTHLLSQSLNCNNIPITMFPLTLKHRPLLHKVKIIILKTHISIFMSPALHRATCRDQFALCLSICPSLFVVTFFGGYSGSHTLLSELQQVTDMCSLNTLYVKSHSFQFHKINKKVANSTSQNLGIATSLQKQLKIIVNS